MIKRIFTLLTVTAVFISAVLYGGYRWTIEQPLNIPEAGRSLEVERGASVNSILNKLESEGVIQSVWPAKVYVRQSDVATSIKVGEFFVPAGTTLPELFAILISNQQIKHKITLVEGTTFSEARATVALNTLLSHKNESISDLELFEKLKAAAAKTDAFGAKHPEGMLYPDTYYFHKGDSGFSVLLRSHERLIEVLRKEWEGKAEGLPFSTPLEALTLASIVEKETGKPSERGEIAGVFARRLTKGMRLQTDPTVIYGLGERYVGNITRAHLKEKTEYNTYRINGLPPTPIALVGKEAIHAALHPKDGKTLYFVAKGDGSHQFSETISQHNQAVRKYQLKRRDDYRSRHQVPN